MKITGATVSDMTHWTRIGLIKASAWDPGGTGNHRRFSRGDLVKIEVARQLNALGLPCSQIGRALNLIRDEAAPRDLVIECRDVSVSVRVGAITDALMRKLARETAVAP
jgi:DNA-binding transcriptional MerR regulator